MNHKTTRTAIVLFFLVLTSYAPVYGQTFTQHVDPKATYFKVNPNDPYVVDAVPVDLGAWNIQPGDLLHLQNRGTFTFWNGHDPEAPNQLAGVFSATNSLGPRDTVNRVIGAVGWVAAPFSTVELATTDIPEDFEISDLYVRVPENCRYLYIAVPDYYYADNVDADGDLRVDITKVDGRFDPRQTFFTVNTAGKDWAMPPQVIDLAAQGINEGDQIILEVRGNFTYSTFHNTPDEGSVLNGVFSGSNLLLDPSAPRRVQNAIPITESTGTAPSYWETWNDIPEDFWFGDVAAVIVPRGAKYLFLGVPDSFFMDNADPNGNLELLLSVLHNVNIASLTLSPSTVFGGVAGPGGATGTITLTQPAPVGGVDVSLGYEVVWLVNGVPSPAIVEIPETITIPEKLDTATFVIQTYPVNFPLKVRIGAKLGTTLKFATLSVMPDIIPIRGAAADARVEAILGQFMTAGAYEKALAAIMDLRNSDPILSQDIYLAAADHYLFAITWVLREGVPSSAFVAGFVPIYEIAKMFMNLSTTPRPTSPATWLSFSWGEAGVADAIRIRYGNKAVRGGNFPSLLP